MCGLTGVILGRKQRRATEREYLADLFTGLLELNEARGPHATGAARVNRDGEHALIKQPMRASAFVRVDDYGDFLDGIDNKTTLLMGHTRWRTRGCERNNRNNHPIRAIDVIGSHNGTIYNAEWLATRFRMRLQTEVDSEVLVRTMACCWGPGGLQLNRFCARLAYFEGQITAAFACKEDPTRVVIIKGNKPLAFRYHKKARAVLYSSLEEHLDEVVADDPGWRDLDIPPMTLAIFSTEAVAEPELHPVRFRAIRRAPTQEEQAP
jgi:glucosamine 6-phosphate synthetase-like amidotransferase/phosphosugar isomerase protein